MSSSKTTRRTWIVMASAGVAVLGPWAAAGTDPHSKPHTPPAHPAPATPAKPAAPAHGAPAAKPAAPAHGAPATKPTTPAPKPVDSSGHGAAAGHATPAPATPAHTTPPVTTSSINADQALAMLVEGNQRWVTGKPENPNIELNRLQMLASAGQKPFVTVLSCADSRVPLERVFDRGVGDVFGVRVAGNIAGDSEIGTVEYGVGHLGTPVLVVLGHTRCGAAAAAASGAQVHGKVAALLGHIGPAVERAKRANPKASGDELAALVVRENVWQTIFDVLKESAECREKVAGGSLKIVGAIYDITNGKVEWLGEHPWQSELTQALNARDGAGAHHGAHAATPSGESAKASGAEARPVATHATGADKHE